MIKTRFFIIFLLSILPPIILFSTVSVNLNTATEKELISTPGITPQIANAILVYRQKYGRFNTVDEIYNACWEMSIPVSEDYVRYLTSVANIYAVSPKNWRIGLADSLQDLINPTVCYYRETENGTNYLFCLFDGGNFVVLTRDVDDGDIDMLKNRIKSRLVFKGVIDWLVVEKPDIDFSLLSKKFKINNVYLPVKYQKSYDKSLNVIFVDRASEVDCLQSYPFYAVVSAIEYSRLSVTFWYESPRVVITPHPVVVKEGVNNPRNSFGMDMFFFDSQLFYYPQKGKQVVKKPRVSVIAQQEREKLLNEFKERTVEDIYEELESAR